MTASIRKRSLTIRRGRAMPHATQMSAADTALLVIDVQEKLIGKILDHVALVRNIRFLLDAAKLLGVPAQATEQYPRGLGPTVPELAKYFPERPDKVRSTSCAVPAVVENLHRGPRPQGALTAIQTPDCLLTTPP